ncbi:phage terminase GpA [Rhizorhabdus wittichii RW1]|uniref:Phage terminase GpA n=1 Tax=Rhizorhabdus wittichii (strain DSM 6014 / CCUG 31198 / JCM 15750 / NBRC 105917 / EY 4224 / RW1) TaxID=392499 RepID=A0A9J9LCK3_RHIWR|nr:phage terminase GpA [Rhizorhabdus wittichii RW1]
MLRRVASIIRPKASLTVSQWAIEHLGYDPETLPWQMEIMDALGDPEVAEVGLMGPAQAGKSEIGLAWLGWSIEHDPAGFMICQPSKVLTQDFVVRRVAPMIKSTSALRGQLLSEVGADNMFLKQFRAMLLTSIWPTAENFRARPVPRGWVDDYDAIDANIEGKGSAVSLMDDRAATFEGRDTKFISSSPADEKGGKIEAFVKGGTHERLMPPCPHCEERIEIDLRRDLRFDDSGSADLAEQTAHVVCSKNGCIIEPHHKRTMIDAMARLPGRGFVVTNLDAGRRRRTFSADGLLCFRSWGRLARQWREAQIEWETLQSEAGLVGFFNGKAGYNYRSILSGEPPIEIKTLAARRRKGWKLGTVPAGVKVIVITVDVQANRFECAAVGYGDGLECWVIDRWTIETLADGLTSVQPLRYREHWAALLPLFSRDWPLADGSGQAAQALTVAIDARGGESDLVTGFWHLCVAAGIHRNRVTLLQGGNNPRAELISRARRSDEKAGGGVKRNSPAKWTVNVHALKNILDARLRREKPGPGYIHFPEDFRELHFDELTAEEKQDGKWKKIRPRNETLDLMVMSYAALLRSPFAGTRTTMSWVPREYRVPEQELPNLMASKNDDGTDPAALGAADIKPSASGSIDETARDRADGQEPGAAVATAAPAAPKRKRRAGGVNPITGRAAGSWLKRN